MRDYTGINFGSLTDASHPDFVPKVRNMLSTIDYYLHDLNRGIQRIQQGDTPQGNPTPLGGGGGDTGIFFLLAGRAAAQTGYGGTGSGASLTLGSTSNATKGFIVLGTHSAFDETNNRLGLFSLTPGAVIHLAQADTPLVARPTSDTGGGSFWVNEAGSGAGGSMFPSIGESARNDSTYVTQTGGQISTLGNLACNTIAGTPSALNTHTVTVRSRYVNIAGPPNTNMGWQFTCGGLTISHNNYVVGTSFSDDVRTLTPTEIASIGANYSGTSFLFSGAGTPGNSNLQVSYVEFRVTAPGTTDLMRWYRDAGATELGSIDSSGRMGVGTGSASLAGVQLQSTALDGTTVPLLLKGAVGQTANLLTVQNSAAVDKFDIDPSGNITTSNTVVGDWGFRGSAASRISTTTIESYNTALVYDGTGLQILDPGTGAVVQLEPGAVTNQVFQLPATSGILVGSAETSTLTNKTIGAGGRIRLGNSAADANGVRFLQSTSTTKYITIDASGLTTARDVKVQDDAGGLAIIVAPTSATTDKTGQTGNIGATTVYTTTHAGLYRFSCYGVFTAASVPGAFTITALWTDPQQAQTLNVVNAGAYSAAGNFFQGECVIRATSGSTIQYSTTLTGTGTYNSYIRVEALT